MTLKQFPRILLATFLWVAYSLSSFSQTTTSAISEIDAYTRDRYYNANRKQLKSTLRYLDLETKKPVKRPEFMDNPIPMYSRVSTLPFGRLL